MPLSDANPSDADMRAVGWLAFGRVCGYPGARIALRERRIRFGGSGLSPERS